MAIQDNPVDYVEEVQPVDMPIEETTVSPTSRQNEDTLAIQAAFLDNYLNGTPVVENYFKYQQTPDKGEQAKQLARAKAQSDSQDIQEALLTDPYQGTGDLEGTLQAATEALWSIDKDAEDVDKHFTEAAMGPEASLEDAEKVSARLKMQKMLSQWTEEIGTGDKVMEVVKYLGVPFLESIRGAKVTGEYFGAKEEFQAMIRVFKMMDEEEQLKTLPALKAELVDKVGDVDGINLLSEFLRPGSSEDFDRFGGSEVAWDLLDATGIGLGVTAALKATAKGANAVKTLRDLKNYEASEEAATLAVIDPEIAQAMGLDDTARAANALPFDTSIEIIEQAGGMSNKVQKKLAKYFDEAGAVTEGIIKAEGFLREQAVSNKYRTQLEKAVEKKFQKEQAENIRVKEKTETETIFEYQVLDEDGNLTDKTYTLSLNLDNAGSFGQSTMGLIREYIGSPTAFARGFLREDVKTAQRTDYLSSKINRQLTNLTESALKPIGLIPTPKTKASLARVDKALREGDEWKNSDGSRGTVFTPDDLRTKFGFETENEISAYYRINRLYNNLWHIRNNEKRLELKTLGYQNINFSKNSENALGKTYENALTARASLNKQSTHYIYDAELDDVVDLRKADVDYVSTAYNDGKILVRMDDPYDIGENRGLYRYALVSKDEVGELPSQVLHRKVGYVPRIYEDAAYFVKERTVRTVDGDKEFFPKKTLRFFDNKKEADQYIESLKATYVAEKLGEIAETGLDAEAYARAEARIMKEADERYIRLTDREEEQLSAAAGEVSHGAGGLYTGARAQDDILFGLEGDRANRVNSFDALTRNIGNLSRYVAINQWRLGMEQRWINTANEIFKAKGIETRIEKFERLPKTSESSPEVRFLNRTFDQIRDWQNFPTPEEQFFSNIMRGLYDWAADGDHKKMAKMLGNFRDSDPISAARATAFHSLLGFFNPAHFWIQAQGAATAISLGFGKYMTRTLGNTMALTMLGYGAKGPQRYAAIAKASLIDKNELEAMHNLWLKTGYEDSVLQTADHAAASKGYGMTMATIKRVADAGLIFYRQGEFFNRRMAFTTAIERWKEKKQLDSIQGIADADLKDIMDDANNIMLNMSKANRAAWQKGLPSLPTQFLQVTTKFVETATGLNKNFTPKERARLLLGQLGLYGTAGIPLSGLGYMVAREVFGMTQEDIDNNPGTVKAINDGFWGVITYHLMGVDMEVSDRGSLLRGISDFVDNWFIQESSVAEKFLGAFGSTGQRFFDELGRRLRPLTLATFSEFDTTDWAGLLTAPILKSFSTMNNIEKAILMERLDMAVSRSGKVVATGFNWKEAVMQAIGFQPTAVTETWDLQARIRHNQQYMRKIQSDMLIEMNRFAAVHPNGDYSDKAWEEHQRNMTWLYSLLDPDEQMQTMKYLRDQMLAPSAKEDAITRYIDNMKNNTAEDMGIIQRTLMGTKALRLREGTEE